MKRVLSLIAVAVLSLSVWAESFASFMGETFGSDINRIKNKVESEGWEFGGTDYSAFNGDFYTYYYLKPNSDGIYDYIMLASSYSENKFCFASEGYQNPSDDVLSSLAEKEKALLNDYSFSKCGENDLKVLHSFFEFDDSDVISDDSAAGDFSEGMHSRFYISDSGNYLGVISECNKDYENAPNMVLFVYGMGKDSQNALGAKISAPKFKAKKNSSEAFQGVPFGSSAVDAVRALKADGWTLEMSEPGANDFMYGDASKEGAKYRGVDCHDLLIIIRDGKLLAGGVNFDCSENGETLRKELSSLEKSMVKTYKAKRATKEEIDAYSEAIGTNFWDDSQKGESEIGNMESGARYLKTKEGTIFVIHANEDGVVILQLAKNKLWQF